MRERPFDEGNLDRYFLMGLWEIVLTRWLPERMRAETSVISGLPPMGCFLEFHPDGKGRLTLAERRWAFDYRKADVPPVYLLTFYEEEDWAERFGDSPPAGIGTVELRSGRLQGFVRMGDIDRFEFHSSRKISGRAPDPGPGGAAAWAIAVPPWLSRVEPPKEQQPWD
jgi:hypothetical protein